MPNAPSNGANAASWAIPLRIAEHFIKTGRSDVAIEVLQLLKTGYDLPPPGRIWLEFHHATANWRLKGIESARNEVEKALGLPINPIAKRELRTVLISHLAEVGDKDALVHQLEEHLSNPVDPVKDAEVMQISKKYGLENGHSFHEHASQPEFNLRKKRKISFWHPGKRLSKSVEKTISETKTAPEVNLYVIDDATVVIINSYVIVFDKEMRVVTQCSNPFSRFTWPGVSDRINNPRERFLGNSAFIRDRFLRANYCHWIVDWLPRLCLIEETEQPIDNIIASEFSSSFQRESLAFVGYDPTKVREISNDGAFQFERLLILDNSTHKLAHPMQFADPKLMNWWRSKVLFPRSGNLRRLYIPRKRQRVILNEDKLVPLLLDYGFEVFDPSQHSFRDQVQSFASAEAVVGGHGAGLTNLLFAPDKCRVLELFPPQGGTSAFFVLATAIGQDYDLIVAAGTNSSTGANDLNYLAPLTEVEKWLRTLPAPTRTG